MKNLKVHPGGRYLETEDGAPFFWLGDTAWELFHALTREEAEQYLQKRAEQGFNVVQAVILAEMDGLRTPNAYGRTPLRKNAAGQYDPLLWDEGGYSYWDHVGWILDKAGEYGIYLALLPTWGDKYQQAHGVGPEIFTPENAGAYGEMVGCRFGDRDNLVWVLGGDRNLAAYADYRVNEALARGLARGEEKRHLATLHPSGEQSGSRFFPGAPWMDFYMIQSGHGRRALPNYRFVEADWALTPAKPVLDAEPRYEDHPVGFRPENGYFDAADVRQAAYWAVFSGSLGITYGHHSVWRMNREPSEYFPLAWQEALERPAARQMRLLKELVLSRPFWERRPAQELLAQNREGSNHMAACRGEGYAFCYTPNGLSVPVRLGLLGGKEIRAEWFSPRTGERIPAGSFPNAGVREFPAPSRGRGEDWVLCLDGKEA